jgi:hypothetical protein
MLNILSHYTNPDSLEHLQKFSKKYISKTSFWGSWKLLLFFFYPYSNISPNRGSKIVLNWDKSGWEKKCCIFLFYCRWVHLASSRSEVCCCSTYKLRHLLPIRPLLCALTVDCRTNYHTWGHVVNERVWRGSSWGVGLRLYSLLVTEKLPYKGCREGHQTSHPGEDQRW